MRKPIIGIVSNIGYIEKGPYKKEVLDVNSDYINMIIRNGGIPIIIPAFDSILDIKEFLKNVDGLLLIGGEDISPSCYSRSKEKKSKRDELEIEIYKYFKNHCKPILGICRGLQLINVAEGGTLTNINDSKINHFIEKDGWVNHHEIFIKNKTILKKIMMVDSYTTSSVHHQKISKIGKNVIVSSRSKDDVIESIEVTGKALIIGFQGHIEKCLDNFDKYNDVIKYFIKEAVNDKR